MKQVADELLAWRARGDRLAIATVVRVSGSTPRPLGATLLAAKDARIAGSVSNGCVEADVYEAAMHASETGVATIIRYGISDGFAFTVGLSCGGQIDVLAEPVNGLHERVAEAVQAGRSGVLASVIAPENRAGTRAAWIDGAVVEGSDPALLSLAAEARDALRAGASRIAHGDEEVFLGVIATPPLLAIVGASDVAMALARLAHALGYRVVISDPREALASRERFPEADELVNAWPEEALGKLVLGGAAAVVILTHDEKFDHPALVAALRSEAGYVGAIGSRRTNEQRFAWLRTQGFGDADLGRIHAPIGLDIGAAGAEETALAILAEIVAVRRARGGGMLSSPTHAAAVR
ncbi:MAG TPA: XdhC/CoxI family protein [Verrucomicrobiae bacterium]|nr:XdhC/CoxI family protein [Verrucomicrobiae bacterium]